MALLEVSVHTLTGATCSIVAESSWTVHDLKVAVKEQLKVPIDEQSLIFGVSHLLDNDSVSTLQYKSEVGLEFTMVRISEEAARWISHLRKACHYHMFLEAPDHIKNSRDVIYAAVCGDGNALQYAPEFFQRDRAIVMAAVKQNCEVFQNVAEEFRSDREIVLVAVSGNGKLLQYASPEMHADRQVIAVALATDSRALLLYPRDRWDVDLVLAAVPEARDASFRSFMQIEKVKEIFGQRDFLMEALEKDPMSLEFASRDLKKDKGLVLHAVKLCWEALQYASHELCSDKDIVASALAQNPLALRFAGARFANDRDLVLDLVARDPRTLKFASRKLQADPVISATAYAAFKQQERIQS